jgi:hypothetical protein
MRTAAKHMSASCQKRSEKQSGQSQKWQKRGVVANLALTDINLPGTLAPDFQCIFRLDRNGGSNEQ